MSDIGNLPLLTFGNCLLNAEWLSGLWNYTYVIYVFLRYLNAKTWLWIFLSRWTRFLAHWAELRTMLRDARLDSLVQVMQ